MHANNLRPYHARVNEALVNNCAIVFYSSEEFGTLPVVEVVSNAEPLPSAKIDSAKLQRLTSEKNSNF